MKHNFACFYHPITVISLDDNKSFLDMMELEIGNYFNLLTFNNPNDALLSVIDEEDIYTNIIKIHNSFESDIIGECLVDVNIKNLHKIIYDKNRFNYPAIAIIDYNMPEMNGIEFCRKINKNNIFKIILTAEEDKDIAIKTFNEGLIEKYLIKTSNDLFINLKLSINELIMRYFAELSKAFIENMNGCLKKLLHSDIFIDLFNQVKDETKAVEYYLIDTTGSLLFLTAEGHPTWLIIRSIEDYNQQIQMLDGFDAPSDLLSSLKDREKLLCLLSDNEFKKPIEQWKQYLFPATRLDDKYYFSVVQGKIFDLVDWGKASFYKNFQFFG